MDLGPVFSGRRSPGDVSSLRPLFYGVQPPAEFLVKSVDAERDALEPDLANPLLPVHWLVDARDAVDKDGLTPEVLKVVKAGFLRVLDCSLSPRERLQVWYCLRSLGVQPPEADANKLLGVILEFPQDNGGLSFLAVYSDRFTAAVWDGGSKRWAAYEEGALSILAQDLFKEAGQLAEGSVPPVSDLPAPLASSSISVAFLHPAGIRFVSLPKAGLAKSPYLSLYNHGATLFGLLCSSSGGELENLPMDLDDPKWVRASLFDRGAAFFADLLVYGVVLGLAFYFSRDAVAKWDVVSRFIVYFLFLAFPPLLGAWMESSPAWAFRTAGKHIFGLTVTSTTDCLGSAFLQALARNLSKWFLSLPFLGCGFLWAVFHRYGRTWHDVLSNTVVLTDPNQGDTDLPPEEARSI